MSIHMKSNLHPSVSHDKHQSVRRDTGQTQHTGREEGRSNTCLAMTPHIPR